ncbi:MAG TPA: DUF1326 domain-containing protein [Gemmatimonadaceae bacterium]|jgi:hypothetical protein|nr:DUF1326 domain-containing protein [Gemmatimonadaceae bacterium]
MAQIPEWHVEGDWFDVCKCSIPCPCTFAQRPSFGDCDGILAYRVRRGHFGDVELDGLNIVAVGHFEGNIWAGETKVTLGMYMDERASEEQRDALRRIWSGEVGGFPAMFAELFGEVRGLEYVPIEIEVADDLAYWRAEIPGKVSARAEALSGPMTPPGKRVQTYNAPGSETGPGTVATWGTAVADKVNAYGFDWDWAGRSSKHIPFDWSGPDGD